jgi:tetratricopeptide (TPR) repeat protein
MRNGGRVVVFIALAGVLITLAFLFVLNLPFHARLFWLASHESELVKEALPGGERVIQEIYAHKWRTGLWPNAGTRHSIGSIRCSYVWRGYDTPPRFVLYPALHCALVYEFPDISTGSNEVPSWKIEHEGAPYALPSAVGSIRVSDRDENDWDTLKINELTARASTCKHIKDGDECSRTWIALVSLLVNSNQLDRAAETLENFITIAAQSSWADLASADVAIRRSNWRRLRELHAKALKSPSMNSGLKFLQVYVANGLMDEAIEMLQVVLAMPRNGLLDWDGLHTAAALALRQKDFDRCMAICDLCASRATESERPRYEFHLFRTAAFLQDGAIQNAELEAERVKEYVNRGEMTLDEDAKKLMNAVNERDTEFVFSPRVPEISLYLRSIE